MTTDKARKRAVRTRMAKTGERYAAARRHVAVDEAPATAPTPPALPPRVADPGMTEAAITTGTGAGWDHWFRLLDGWGGVERSHTDIARFIREEQGVSGWWAQAVTVGYERARGLRAMHQTKRGFEVSVSRTVAAPPADVWAAFLEPRGRRRWIEAGAHRQAADDGRDRPIDVVRRTRRDAHRGRDRRPRRRPCDRDRHARGLGGRRGRRDATRRLAGSIGPARRALRGSPGPEAATRKSHPTVRVVAGAEARSVPSAGADHRDLARESGQPLDTARGRIERDEVLDADAHLAIEVDPGLDGEDRRARERRLRGGLPE